MTVLAVFPKPGLWYGQEMTMPSDLLGLDLQVYSATWCGDCRRLERWLAENQVSYVKVDIETSPDAAERLERETGKRAIPFLLVAGKRWVRGYHRELPGRFDPGLLVKEILEAAQD
jgi:glutaredoxin